MSNALPVIIVSGQDGGGGGSGSIDSNISEVGGTAVNGGIPVTGTPVTPTDHSGTIATGGSAQQLMAANSSRRGFWVQNVSSDDLWLNDLGTANTDQPSMLLPSGALYESPMSGVSTGAISIIGATTSQAFSAREW